ncbi:MAG: aminotransferase class I/II-fold pyridoxal phosphate-dependent enzyme [Desulfobacterales bacterium]|jgi:threonine-phosphate decarboxylase
MIYGHGGNIYDVARQLNCKPADIIDMSSNINPLGPPPGLLQYLKDNLASIMRLPEVDAGTTVKRFGRFIGVDSNRLLAGNGTTQFIYSIPRVLETRKALIIGPTYADYGDACRLQGIPYIFHMTDESDEFTPRIDQISKKLPSVDTVFVCNPNNPTGALIPGDALSELCRCHPQHKFVIDESYLDFVYHAERETLTNSGLPNVMVLLSLSKIFRIPGLRIGFIAAPQDQIEKFRKHLLPWSVSSLAQQAIDYVSSEKALMESFILETRNYIADQRLEFYQALKPNSRLRLFTSQAPFVIIQLPDGFSGNRIWKILAWNKILVRRCNNIKGLSDRFIRISLKKRSHNRLLASKLNTLFSSPNLEFRSRKELRAAG